MSVFFLLTVLNQSLAGEITQDEYNLKKFINKNTEVVHVRASHANSWIYEYDKGLGDFLSINYIVPVTESAFAVLSKLSKQSYYECQLGNYSTQPNNKSEKTYYVLSINCD